MKKNPIFAPHLHKRIMAKQTETTQDPIANVEDALTKSELFIEKNQKLLLMVLGGIILVVGGFFAYRNYVVKPHELEAQAAIFRAERFFEKDSFQLALNGKDKAEGFLSIIDNYSGTKTGNLAHYYASVCYLHLGKYQECLDQMDQFDADDVMLGAMSVGVKGDALMELNRTDEAIEMYTKAASTNENSFTSPMYLMKAGVANEIKGDYNKALELYQKIRKNYFSSNEGREVEKYIARAELMVKQGGK
jgi:tetratricopeptide (TPR) repeat protein